LISGEMSKFHLPADIYTNREVQEEEWKLFELFALFMLEFMTNFIKGQEILLSFFLIMKLHEIFTNLLHSALSILNGLNLLNCFLLWCYSYLLLIFLIWLLLFLFFFLLFFLFFIFFFLF
jgi:hypothetical protein